ncbi:MAG: hypothetical protein ACI4WS_11300 [Oscillospiraceae bacterium]
MSNYIGAYEVTGIAQAVSDAIGCIRDIAVTHEREATARYGIQKRFELCVKAIEADTERFRICAQVTRELNSKILDAVCAIATREHIDQTALAMTEKLLGVLESRHREMYSCIKAELPLMLRGEV